MRVFSGFLARWSALALLAVAAGGAGSLAVVTSVRAHRVSAPAAPPRIVPDRSTNWVGYVFLARHVTGVRAEWTEPETEASRFSGHTYQPTGPEAEAVWLGVGGDFSTDIMQAGTEAYLGGPNGVDEAWYERWPLDPHQVNASFEVWPQDVIRTSLTLVAGSSADWRISITETATGATWSRLVHYSAPVSGPEFVVEDPARTRDGRLFTLPRWGSVAFLHMQIRVGRTWRPAGSFSGFRLDMVRHGTVLATAGPLHGGGSSFIATQN
jgi:hypothetical protein